MKKTLRTAKQQNRCLYFAGVILFILGIILTGSLTVSAETEKCSLTLKCVFSVKDGKRILSGDEYSIVKVADAEFTEDRTIYKTLEVFRSFDSRWTDIPSSELDDIAEDISDYCKEKRLFTFSAVTDKNGELVFSDLEPGLYLVSRTKTASSNEDFITDPLLVFLPEEVDGEVIFDVVSTPKYSYITPENNDSLPQTGQLLWPVAVFSVIGGFLIVCGLLLFRKEDKGEK